MSIWTTPLRVRRPVVRALVTFLVSIVLAFLGSALIPVLWGVSGGSSSPVLGWSDLAEWCLLTVFVPFFAGILLYGHMTPCPAGSGWPARLVLPTLRYPLPSPVQMAFDIVVSCQPSISGSPNSYVCGMHQR